MNDRMNVFLSTQIVTASAEESPSGESGYRVLFPNGNVTWVAAGTFKLLAREITSDELKLLKSCELHNAQREEKING